MSNDFYREFDLNPTPGGTPVTSPDDPRAMFYFGFISKGQEIQTLFGGTRVLVSFSYANKAAPFSGQPLQPDAILDVTSTASVRYDGDHERAHVLVWVDTSAGVPPINTPAVVRVRAWA